MTTGCIAAAVWLGVVGCAYPVHQRASSWLVVEARRIRLRTRIDRGAAGFVETMLVASGRGTIGRLTYAIKAPTVQRVLQSVIADGPRELFVKLFEGGSLQDRMNEYLSRGKFAACASRRPVR